MKIIISKLKYFIYRKSYNTNIYGINSLFSNPPAFNMLIFFLYIYKKIIIFVFNIIIIVRLGTNV